MKLSVHISQQCWQDVDWASLVIALLLTPQDSCWRDLCHSSSPPLPPRTSPTPSLVFALSLSFFLSYPNFSLCLPPRPAPQFSPVFGWKGFQYNSLCFYIINFLRCMQKPRFSVCITADMVDKIAAVHNMWQWGSSKMRQESGGGVGKKLQIFSISAAAIKQANKTNLSINDTLKSIKQWRDNVKIATISCFKNMQWKWKQRDSLHRFGTGTLALMLWGIN